MILCINYFNLKIQILSLDLKIMNMGFVWAFICDFDECQFILRMIVTYVLKKIMGGHYKAAACHG